jgi:hypothetical protein
MASLAHFLLALFLGKAQTPFCLLESKEPGRMRSSPFTVEIQFIAHRVGTEPSCFDAHHAPLPEKRTSSKQLGGPCGCPSRRCHFPPSLREIGASAFSAHQRASKDALKLIAGGDPYRGQARRTAARVAEDLFDEVPFSERVRGVCQKDLGSVPTRAPQAIHRVKMPSQARFLLALCLLETKER